MTLTDAKDTGLKTAQSHAVCSCTLSKGNKGQVKQPPFCLASASPGVRLFSPNNIDFNSLFMAGQWNNRAVFPTSDMPHIHNNVSDCNVCTEQDKHHCTNCPLAKYHLYPTTNL
jgi:hypothetical protein